MSKDIQVFTAFSPKRWQRVKAIFGAISVIVFAGFGVFVLSVVFPNRPALPSVFEPVEHSIGNVISDNTRVRVKQNWIPTYQGGFGKRLSTAALPPLTLRTPLPYSKQIRAAFLERDRKETSASLREYVSQLNMVIPNWLRLAPLGEGDSIQVRVDTLQYSILMQNPKTAVLPRLTITANNPRFAQLLMNISDRVALISSLRFVLQAYHFQGVLVEYQGWNWEQPNEKIEKVKIFQKELYQALSKNYKVAQLITPKDAFWEGSVLYNDYIFVETMTAPDENIVGSGVPNEKHIEMALRQLVHKIPAEKAILCIPTDGYDWKQTTLEATAYPERIGYQQAVSIAAESKTKISFNKETTALSFNYLDDQRKKHHVYFADAANHFNAMRLAQNAAWCGVALSNIGGEDTRLWSFYNKDLSIKALDATGFRFDRLRSELKNDKIHFMGEGEVLDVISEPTQGKVTVEYDVKHHKVLYEKYDSLPSAYLVRRTGSTEAKKIVLSFDDGPDPTFTPQVLDILKQEQVHATFFMLGKLVKEYPKIVKRVYEEGHEIGNHTFSHPHLNQITRFRANIELDYTRRAIESVTGHSTILFRAPYSYNNEPDSLGELMPFLLARKHQYLSVGESIDPRDWEQGITTDSILARLEWQHRWGNIVLLHDAGGKDRTATIQALPKIISYYRKKGYEFTTVAGLLGKTKEEVMPIVAGRQATLGRGEKWLSGVVFQGGSWLKSLFYWSIWLSIGRIVFVGVLACIQKYRDERAFRKPQTAPIYQPPVSIIVPAYGEELNAVQSVRSLLNQNYPNFEILFIDDGSKDNTYNVVKEAFKDSLRVKVFTKPNGGKASALNYGIAQSQNEFIVGIDADTQLVPNALAELLAGFYEDRVGAVAGNVQVGNQVNTLTRWQAVEYTTAQNFDRMAFDVLNCITVVPGAIGAFRRTAIQEAGGFTTDTLAEDCDLTMRILRKGWRVKQNNSAIAITEAPESFAQFRKQRFRWSFGVMQAFWKNKDALLQPRYRCLGLVALPNILFFQLFLPLFAPLADLILISELVTGGGGDMLNLYLVFMAIDLFCALLAFTFEGVIRWKTLFEWKTWVNPSKWKLWLILLLFPQRIVYRPIMYVILFKSYIKALKGELMGWGVLKRTGNINLSQAT
jgi:cellulose synthase/poly-beta-1,6-N-acetylglucosamine synthase-like glycosyltransferase/peptidoglycan/xylan/chitin deacetylase (PgdA/CDA1 family)/spore germination protein YaaH